MTIREAAREKLIESFADICAEELSSSIDDAQRIAAYISGSSDEMPKLQGGSGYYAFRTSAALKKLNDGKDTDAFLRACALIIRTGPGPRKNTWEYQLNDTFEELIGNDFSPRGLGGQNKSTSAQQQEIQQRLAGFVQYAGSEELVKKVTLDLKRMTFVPKSASPEYYVVKTLMLTAMLLPIVGRALDEAVAKLPVILSATLLDDTETLQRAIDEQVALLLDVSNTSVSMPVGFDFTDEYTQIRTQRARELYGLGQESATSKEAMTPTQIAEKLNVIINAFLYTLNRAGSKTNLLDAAAHSDRVTSLLRAVRALHERYPLEVRDRLVSMDARTANYDVLLEGIVEADDPFALMEKLWDLMGYYRIGWSACRTNVISEPEQAVRLYEIVGDPFLRLYIRKTLGEHDESLISNMAPIDELVEAYLRHKRYGKKQGILMWRYLNEEMSAEAYLESKECAELLQVRNNGRGGTDLRMVAVSMLSMQTEAYRRMVVLLSQASDGLAIDALSQFCSGGQFNGLDMLAQYKDDPEVNVKKLVRCLYLVNGREGYYTTTMDDESYRQLILAYTTEALDNYAELPIESRVTILETIYGAEPQQETAILALAIRLGLTDNSKQINRVAISELDKPVERDAELYVNIYRSEKRAAIKERVLHTVRRLPNNAQVLEALLEKEKNETFRSLIQALLDTADKPPQETHALIAKLSDPKKLQRIDWLEVKDLPPLLDHSGQALDSNVSVYLLLQAVEFTTEPNEQLREIAEYADAESLSRFAAELIQLWVAQEAPAKEKWVLYVGSLFGTRSMVDLLSPLIKDWTEHSRGAIAAEAVKALSYLNEPAALLVIDQLQRTIKNKQVKSAAEEALQQAARTQGLTTEQLGDRLVTTLGFDANGQQLLSYGEREFQIQVNRELQVIVINPDTGKIMKSMPAPNAKDDAALAAESKAKFTQLKKDLKTMVGIQAQRLEESLSKMRLWTKTEWQDLFVQNIIMQKFAVGLIWGVYQDGVRSDTFRYMEDGTYNTIDEEEYDWSDDAKVGLVHPLELTEDERASWIEQLDDYEVNQPFAQLQRTTYRLEEDDLAARSFTRLPSEELSPTALPKALEKYGWYKGRPMDGGFYTEFYKEYGEHIAELKFSGTSIAYYEGMDNVTLEAVVFYPNLRSSYHYYDMDEALKLSDISERAFSETIYDIMRAAGRGE